MVFLASFTEPRVRMQRRTTSSISCFLFLSVFFFKDLEGEKKKKESKKEHATCKLWTDARESGHEDERLTEPRLRGDGLLASLA